MSEVDALAPNYLRAKEHWPDAPNLSHCYREIVACYAGTSHGLVEHVKAMLESVCVTILEEFGRPMPSSTPSTTELLVEALRPLGLYNTRGASKMDKVLSGYNRLSDALSEMRNEQGTVAHGKDGFIEALEADHARAFLHTGDTIIGLLLNALEGKEPDLSKTREPYERFPHHNKRIDRSVGVEVAVDPDGDLPVVVLNITTGGAAETIEIRVEPSRLLYGVDRSAYIEVLSTAAAELADQEEPEATVFEPVEKVHPALETDRPPLASVVTGYEGRFAMLRPRLESFLRGEGWPTAEAEEGEDDLVGSLLAAMDQNLGLDWKNRELLQARLKVASRRLLVRFGFERQRAEEVAERFIAWLRIQVPDGEVSVGQADVS
jgi:hypothetical protein